MNDSSVTTQPSPDVIRTCSELFRRTMLSQSILTSALEIPRMSGVFQERVFRDHVTGASGMRELLQDRELFTSYNPEGDFAQIAELLARQAALNGEMVIAGAVIVLSHSTADDVFTGACDAAIRLEPKRWMQELNLDRDIKLRDLKEKGVDAIFQEELDRFKKQLSDKSLPKRAELLFRHVRIVQNSSYSSADPQYFRASTLKEADDLRHDMVHRNALPHANLRQSTNMMLFLHEAAITALRSLGAAYRIPFDPTVLFPGITMTNSASSVTAAEPAPRRPRDRA